jgi:hypothetical protein
MTRFPYLLFARLIYDSTSRFLVILFMTRRLVPCDNCGPSTLVRQLPSMYISWLITESWALSLTWYSIQGCCFHHAGFPCFASKHSPLPLNHYARCPLDRQHLLLRHYLRRKLQTSPSLHTRGDHRYQEAFDAYSITSSSDI